LVIRSCSCVTVAAYLVIRSFSCLTKWYCFNEPLCDCKCVESTGGRDPRGCVVCLRYLAKILGSLSLWKLVLEMIVAQQSVPGGRCVQTHTHGTHTQALIHARMHAAHTYIHAHTAHTHKRSYMHACTRHTHTHIHTYTYTSTSTTHTHLIPICHYLCAMGLNSNCAQRCPLELCSSKKWKGRQWGSKGGGSVRYRV